MSSDDEDHIIHIAAKCGNRAVVENLLNEASSLVNVKGAGNRTPLANAVLGDNLPWLDFC